MRSMGLVGKRHSDLTSDALANTALPSGMCSYHRTHCRNANNYVEVLSVNLCCVIIVLELYVVFID